MPFRPEVPWWMSFCPLHFPSQFCNYPYPNYLNLIVFSSVSWPPYCTQDLRSLTGALISDIMHHILFYCIQIMQCNMSYGIFLSRAYAFLVQCASEIRLCLCVCTCGNTSRYRLKGSHLSYINSWVVSYCSVSCVTYEPSEVFINNSDEMGPLVHWISTYK
jgi:hypothetical protein